MKIINLSIRNSICFLSKNKENKLADDIVRKTRHEFPAFSPSYIASYWYCTRSSRCNEKKEKAIRLMSEIDKKLLECRIDTDFRLEIIEDELGLLKATKKHKTANCIEYAQLAEACLLANGIKNSKLAKVKIRLTILNKDTPPKKAYEHTETFDHVIVLSSLDDENYSNNPFVLDAWIGKAMSNSEAKREYLGMLDKNDVDKIIKNGIEDYKTSTVQDSQGNTEINANNFNYRIQIFFEEMEDSFLKRKFNENPETTTKSLRLQFSDLLLNA